MSAAFWTDVLDRRASWCIVNHDSLAVLRQMPSDCVDALVTDPPAGISFMAREWDDDKGGRFEWIVWLADIMRECFRVMKPGAHGLVWALPRTSHWTGTALENSGFRIKDRLAHVFGSGMPKGGMVWKQIDKMHGATPRVVGSRTLTGNAAQTTKEKGGTYASNTDSRGVAPKVVAVTAPTSDEAKQWEGWATHLKPAVEDWWLIQKPTRTSVARNVVAMGTGAINVEATRVGTSKSVPASASRAAAGGAYGSIRNRTGNESGFDPNIGRWPANALLTHAPDCVADECVDWCPCKILDDQSGDRPGMSGGGIHAPGYGGGMFGAIDSASTARNDFGGASRFFTRFEHEPPFLYCQKPSTTERERGCEELVPETVGDGRATTNDTPYLRDATQRRNIHPTVKSVALMRWLCKLITPPGGVVIDPFAGSGSTGVAALAEGLRFVGIELGATHCDIARSRIIGDAPLLNGIRCQP